MRLLTKFLIILFTTTVISLYYVGQQSTLLSLSYEIGQNQAEIERLLDQNNNLIYNSDTLKSPQNLEKVLVSKNVNLYIPGREQIIYLAKKESPQREQIKSARRNIFSFFNVTSKAEAEPVKRH